MGMGMGMGMPQRTTTPSLVKATSEPGGVGGASKSLSFGIVNDESLLAMVNNPKSDRMDKKENNPTLQRISSWAGVPMANNNVATPARPGDSLSKSSNSFEQFQKLAKEKEEKARSQKLREQEQQGVSLSGRDQPREEGVHAKPPQLDSEVDRRRREIERRKEQERRKRQALAGTVDMNFQSDVMTGFEETMG